MLRIMRDFSLSAAVAGLVALFATYSGPVLIVVQAAQAGGLSAELLSTWIWAVSIGAGCAGLWPTLRHRMPVIGAWSTPGVALLISGLAQYPFSDVIGCYLVLTVLVTLIGATGLFTWLMARLPAPLLSAMIAGVLFQFCTKIFQALHGMPAVVLPVLVTYLLCRRALPRYAVAAALAVGILVAAGHAGSAPPVELTLARPELTWPTFSLDALVGLGLPLLILALTQFATAIHVLRNAGYEISPKSVVGVSGVISIPLSLFGSSGTNPAAIVGAICASPESHADPRRRYISGVVCGVGYLAIGIFGASVVALFALLPAGLTTTLAGLALLGTLASSLASSLADETEREAALVTFLATASGISFFGLGSALWGLVLGGLTLAVMKSRMPRSPHPVVAAGTPAEEP
ncbi:transporter [Noviherbaspirillum aridicola]|uniref:Transporter n=2 Tax=Noviherbaspirillum aridicola TaxID=2849687 RepID=A0ABQ4Q1F7_9BURK|nr:transporter [Noviherbaspirillum aridicola]